MKKNNVVLIMADQLRKDYLGCYGNPYVNTPNIDRIAEMGIRFQNCFVNNPICMPSRMSIFTGMYVHNHQLWANGVLLPQELPTIGSCLGKCGYRTASIGKAHLEPYGAQYPRTVKSREDWRRWAQDGMQQWHGPFWGFDYIELVLSHTTRPIGHYQSWFYENGGNREMAGQMNACEFAECRTTRIPEGLHDSAYIGERSARYIREKAQGESPFFLTVSFPDPHHPFNPPEETAKKYIDTPIQKPVAEDDDLASRPAHYKQHQEGIWYPAGVQQILPGMTEEEKQYVQESRELAAKFRNKSSKVPVVGDIAGRISQKERDLRIRNTYAMIDLIDRAVGEVLEALKETGEMENTLIIFTADHGELMGDHGLWKKGPFFYDGEINVPLLMKIPEMGHSECSAIVSSIDIYPTVLETLGLKVPEYIDGISQFRALNGENPREQCLLEYRTGFGKHDLHANVLIDKNYKFVQYSNGECELTDRVNDLEERRNLAVEETERKLVCRYQEKLLLMLLGTPAKYPERIAQF